MIESDRAVATVVELDECGHLAELGAAVDRVSGEEGFECGGSFVGFMVNGCCCCCRFGISTVDGEKVGEEPFVDGSMIVGHH